AVDRRRVVLPLLHGLGEERVELVLAVDRARVLGAERDRAGVEGVLDLVEGPGEVRDELGAGDARRLRDAAVAAADEDGVLLEVARPDLDAERDALLDPLARLLAAAD